jgi:hypothetical protein
MVLAPIADFNSVNIPSISPQAKEFKRQWS